jgi:hypothetical protein
MDVTRWRPPEAGNLCVSGSQYIRGNRDRAGSKPRVRLQDSSFPVQAEVERAGVAAPFQHPVGGKRSHQTRRFPRETLRGSANSATCRTRHAIASGAIVSCGFRHELPQTWSQTSKLPAPDFGPGDNQTGEGLELKQTRAPSAPPLRNRRLSPRRGQGPVPSTAQRKPAPR